MTPPLLYNGKCIATDKTCKDSGCSATGSCRTCYTYKAFMKGISIQPRENESQLESQKAGLWDIG